MIICHRHHFIFVKTMKTAGTSLELALSQACGPQDVVTRIRPAEPELEQRTDIDFNQAVFVHQPSGTKRILRQHSGLGQAAMVLGRRIRNYKIIASERNPWTKLQSSFFWKLHHSPKQVIDDGAKPDLQAAFKRFVLAPVQDPCDAFDMYSYGGVPLVDCLIRFENLGHDLSDLARDMGLPPSVRLPARAAKSGIRPPGLHLAFDDEMDRSVRGRFAREIAWFGYNDPESDGQAYRPDPCLNDWKSRFFSTHGETGWAPSAGT